MADRRPGTGLSRSCAGAQLNIAGSVTAAGRGRDGERIKEASRVPGSPALHRSALPGPAVGRRRSDAVARAGSPPTQKGKPRFKNRRETVENEKFPDDGIFQELMEDEARAIEEKTEKQLENYRKAIAARDEELCMLTKNVLNCTLYNQETSQRGNNLPSKLTVINLIEYLESKGLDPLQIANTSTRDWRTILPNNVVEKITIDDKLYDLDTFVGEFEFNGHHIKVEKGNSKTCWLYFYRVPSNVDDSELLHFTEFYGDIVRKNEVKWEKVREKKYNSFNGTRKIEIQLRPGLNVPGFIWIEGTDGTSSRISTFHRNQIRQCYNCLQVDSYCPGSGYGINCKYTQRTTAKKYDEYMYDLYLRTGYRSLYKENKYRNAMTTKGDDQLDRLWKRVTNKLSNDLNYIMNIIINVEKSISIDDVRNETVDQTIYTDLVIEAFMDQIDSKRNPENQYKEDDVTRNLQKIIPIFWTILFDKAKNEELLVYDLRKEMADKSRERKNGEEINLGQQDSWSKAMEEAEREDAENGSDETDSDDSNSSESSDQESGWKDVGEGRGKGKGKKRGKGKGRGKRGLNSVGFVTTSSKWDNLVSLQENEERNDSVKLAENEVVVEKVVVAPEKIDDTVGKNSEEKSSNADLGDKGFAMMVQELEETLDEKETETETESEEIKVKSLQNVEIKVKSLQNVEKTKTEDTPIQTRTKSSIKELSIDQVIQITTEKEKNKERKRALEESQSPEDFDKHQKIDNDSNNVSVESYESIPSKYQKSYISFTKEVDELDFADTSTPGSEMNVEAFFTPTNQLEKKNSVLTSTMKDPLNDDIPTDSKEHSPNMGPLMPQLSFNSEKDILEAKKKERERKRKLQQEKKRRQLEEKENVEDVGKKGRRVSVGDPPPTLPTIPKKRVKDVSDGNHSAKPPLNKDSGKQVKVLSEKQNVSVGKTDYVRTLNERGAKGSRP